MSLCQGMAGYLHVERPLALQEITTDGSATGKASPLPRRVMSCRNRHVKRSRWDRSQTSGHRVLITTVPPCSLTVDSMPVARPAWAMLGLVSLTMISTSRQVVTGTRSVTLTGGTRAGRLPLSARRSATPIRSDLLRFTHQQRVGVKEQKRIATQRLV